MLASTLHILADASMTKNDFEVFANPLIAWMVGIATLVCTVAIIYSAISYITATGDPEKLRKAKRSIKYAIIGLILVVGASFLVAALSNSYSAPTPPAAEQLPELQNIQNEDETGFWSVLTKAAVSLLRNIIESAGEPFLKALSYFLNSTPLMAENRSVLDLWRAVLVIANILLVAVIALRGFGLMTFSIFGLDNQDIKQLLPQIVLVFVAMNSSIYLIDGIIILSNAMIHALKSGFPSTDIWGVMADITKQSSSIGIAGLLVMVAFLALSVMLLVYYVLRLVSLYLGAILAPLVILLYLIPVFKDFAYTALKTYLTTIFVLFVHVVILLLSASLFTGIFEGDTNGQPNNLMGLIVALATVVMLLKTQGFMQELSYAASAPRSAREISNTFMKGVSSITHNARNISKMGSSSSTASHSSGLPSSTNPPTRVYMNKPSSGSKLKTGETKKAEKKI